MNDETIVALFWDRDERAVTEAQKHYGDYCLYIAGNILRDDGAAEECLNDALLAAWDTIPPKRPENLKTYLGMLVRTAAVDRSRRIKAQKRGPGSVESLEELGELAVECDVEQTAGAREVSRLISDHMRTLGEAERNVFIRRYWYYDSIEAICRRYGFGKSRVKMMLKRTRDSLAEYLKKEGHDEY